MSSAKPLILCLSLLLPIARIHAQTPTSVKPTTSSHQELTVRVVLPTTVGLIGDYAEILLSKEEGKLKKLTTRRRPRTSNPTLVFSMPIPKNWITRKLVKDDK
jgi:hypothetical protein